MKNRTSPTLRARAKFFEALARTGIVTDACALSGIKRQRAYELRDADPEFKRSWEAAQEIAADSLEREARRRALDGCEKIVVSSGRVVFDPADPEGKTPLRVREYSDTLLALLLKARRSEVFGDKQKIEHSGEIRTRIPEEELDARLSRLIEKKAQEVAAGGDGSSQS